MMKFSEQMVVVENRESVRTDRRVVSLHAVITQHIELHEKILSC